MATELLNCIDRECVEIAFDDLEINTIFHVVDQKKDLPEVQEYTDVLIRKNKGLSSYMESIVERTERIRAKRVSRYEDNMLKIATDGRKAALDLRLVEREQPYNQYSKVYQCVKQVMRIYNKYQNCSQLVFCDYSTPKNDKFNIYNELKAKLIEQGMKEQEIAFIHSYHTEMSRLKLFDKVNRGEVRVLIGSTFKLGIGTNVQTKLKAIHHLDVPWRPADMVQREGRILRQGNENRRIVIFRYIAENSFDSYSWQILETKQKFITQFLKGSTYQRTASDLDSDVLSYAHVKALALAQPLMKQLAEKDNQIKNLQILLNKEVEAEKNLIQENKLVIEQLKRLHELNEKDENNYEFIQELGVKWLYG